MKKIFIVLTLFLTITSLKSQNNQNNHFGFMHPGLAIFALPELNVHWERLHPGPFIWGLIENPEGVFNFAQTDSEIVLAQDHDVYIIATIWPFADWDQKSCHSKCTDETIFGELGEYRQKPCNMQAYLNFLTRLVERYDGDSIDDMPGLTIPIKHWEIINEPEIEPKWFFCSDKNDYLDILRQSYEAIKTADPEALVLNGGTMGTQEHALNYWRWIFDNKGYEYFDIFNYHQIGCDSSTNISIINNFLNEYQIDKPVWLTETEFKEHSFQPGPKPSAEDWKSIIAKAHVNAFAGGVEKIFYVGLTISPASRDTWLLIPDKDFKTNKDFKFHKTTMFTVYQNMVNRLDGFTSVETLGENFFKFRSSEDCTYVYWGSPPLSNAFKDTLFEIDLYGKARIVQKNQLKTTNIPVYLKNADFEWIEVNPGHGSGTTDKPEEDGPWKHRVLSANSYDGINWIKENTILADQASVPDAILDKNGKIRVYYVDAYNKCLTVAIQQEDTSYKYYKVMLNGQTHTWGVDPDILFLPDGRYGLYFFRQESILPGPEDPHIISLAASNDGVIFFTEEDTCYSEFKITDPDVVILKNGKFHMFLSKDSKLISCISDDGLKFTKQGELNLGGSVSGTTQFENIYRVYFPEFDGFNLNINSAVNPDPENISGWVKEEGPRIQSGIKGQLDSLGAADPSVIMLMNGLYKMFYKTFIGEETNTYVAKSINVKHENNYFSAYPNPFNTIVKIRYSISVHKLPEKLRIFNINGKMIKEFYIQNQKGEIVWDGTNNQSNKVSSGVYFYKLERDFKMKKFILLK